MEFIKDLPNNEIIESIADDKHNLFVIDDLQFSALNDSVNLFSREAHHRNISVFLILINIICLISFFYFYPYQIHLSHPSDYHSLLGAPSTGFMK